MPTILIFIFLFISAAWSESTQDSASTIASRFNFQFEEFPIGMYSVDKVRIQEMAEAGFNYVHTYGLSWDVKGGQPGVDSVDIEHYRNYLDEAAQHQLKVLFNIDAGRYRGYYYQEGVLTPSDSAHPGLYQDSHMYLQRLNRIVKEFKDHPALGMWTIFDEPDAFASKRKRQMKEEGYQTLQKTALQKSLPSEIHNYYSVLRHQTPHIPVGIVLAWSEHWNDYFEVSDIIFWDKYPKVPQVVARGTKETTCELPFPMNHPLRMGADVKRRAPSAGLGPIVQAYDRGCGLPNYEELKYFAFSTLSLGVEALFWYSDYEVRKKSWTEVQEFYQGPMKQIIAEVKAFAKQAKDISQPQDVLINDSLKVVQWEAKDGSETLLILNTTPKTYSTTVELNTIPLNLRDSTQTTMSVELKPWGVELIHFPIPSQEDHTLKSTAPVTPPATSPATAGGQP